jgi:hypothetical protein
MGPGNECRDDIGLAAPFAIARVKRSEAIE